MPNDIHDDDVTITLRIPNDVWDMLMEVTEEDDDWRTVAARALEAGLEQAAAPTNASGRPRSWRGR